MTDKYNVPQRLNTQQAYSGRLFGRYGVGPQLLRPTTQEFSLFHPTVEDVGDVLISDGLLTYQGWESNGTIPGGGDTTLVPVTFVVPIPGTLISSIPSGWYIYLEVPYLIQSVLNETDTVLLADPHEHLHHIAEVHFVPDRDQIAYAIRPDLIVNDEAEENYLYYPIAHYVEISGVPTVYQFQPGNILIPRLTGLSNFTNYPISYP